MQELEPLQFACEHAYMHVPLRLLARCQGDGAAPAVSRCGTAATSIISTIDEITHTEVLIFAVVH